MHLEPSPKGGLQPRTAQRRSVPGWSFKARAGQEKELVIEVERHPETPIKVSGTGAQPVALPFSILFSTEIINALC